MDLSRLTLGEWYEGHFVRLFHAGARPGTVDQYRNTLRIWERVTGGPLILAINQYTLADFRSRCPGKDATIAKHARHLNHLLSKLGPPGPRNRDALELLPRVPWFRPPTTPEPTPRIPTDADVGAIVAKAPLDIALFTVVAATTGSRNGAIRALTADGIEAGAQVLRFPAHTDKRRRERAKPIPSITLKWLQKHEREIAHWQITKRGFASRWNRWAAKAGVPTLRPHGLKRWWAATLIRHGASPWCVKFALDHAQRDVTGMHYLQPFDELAALVDKIALPESFTTRLQHQTQRTLQW